jgi:hypothetical protein
MPLENILSDLTAEIKALRLTIAAGMKAPAAFTVEAAAAPVAAPAPIEAAAPTAEAAPVQSEAAAPVSDTVAADQAPAAAESVQTPAKTEQKTHETQAENEKTDESRSTAPAKNELPPVTDAVTARRSEQEKKAAEVEPGLQAKIEITQIYNDAREKGLTDPCGALIIEACKSLGFPRFSAVPADRLPELVAAFSAAVTARQEA